MIAWEYSLEKTDTYWITEAQRYTWSDNKNLDIHEPVVLKCRFVVHTEVMEVALGSATKQNEMQFSKEKPWKSEK